MFSEYSESELLRAKAQYILGERYMTRMDLVRTLKCSSDRFSEFLGGFDLNLNKTVVSRLENIFNKASKGELENAIIQYRYEKSKSMLEKYLPVKETVVNYDDLEAGGHDPMNTKKTLFQQRVTKGY